MNDNKYNGWSNYATWRVNLEILGDMDWHETGHVGVDYLKELVEDTVFGGAFQFQSTLAEDYALAFLSEVNYYEILESILDQKEMNKEYENEETDI